ncbi:hypothetical protein [Nocardioides sediminis]|uniref:hypothetical protein n=1 Tax=Nocardioides sediminis TaxID=433648 RepID=UPI000D3232AF|nr:hypothetical protein [Nocardioides sediminis]
METSSGGTAPQTLSVELEDVATRSWWKSALGLLTTQTQMWHFVGLLEDRPVYESPTFAAPYSWGRLPLGRTMLPQEEWAPGMQQALEELRAAIREDGWVECGHGAHPWEDVYSRPRA